jgi:hypothetical protein
MTPASACPSRSLPAVVRQAQDLVQRVAGDPSLDAVADGASGAVAPLSEGRARGLLRGDWLGHAFHPLGTDFTNGPWMGASLLDLFGPRGSGPAARRLVGLGLLAAVPTWLSGAVDWQESRGRDRRVGLLHAATSTVATALYAASYVARRRGEGRRGAVLGLLGGLVGMGDGYVGGDLTLVARVGTGRRTGSGGRSDVAVCEHHLPELVTLEDIAPYVADDVYLRFSRGPVDDRDRTSRDYESGLELPGLSAIPLAPAPWWDRPWEDWVARQVCKYLHLETEADDDRYGWLLRGRIVSRGPDSEPLIEAPVPLARLSDGFLEAARTRYGQRFEVGNDST